MAGISPKPAGRRVRRIDTETLFGLKDATKGWKPYFYFTGERSRILIRANRDIAHWGRYPNLNRFLENNRNRIRVFADVGAGNAAGAPTAVEAKEILGKDCKVYAVDIFKPDKTLCMSDVQVVHLAIQKKPLPFQCDAIRFTNVSHYMTREDLAAALDNIWASLKMHGFLLGANELRTSQKDFLANKQHEFVLIKVKKTKRNPHGFVELEIPISH
ncbi:MAG TPA: class I SAM-dependent methyltransferase [archaeon]|nr:class I SAM-dependent methyltransferase [archaeon]